MSTIQLRKPYPLRKQESTSIKNSTKKKDGTLQKIGDFFQSSPTIIQSKGLYRTNKSHCIFSGHCRIAFFYCNLLIHILLDDKLLH